MQAIRTSVMLVMIVGGTTVPIAACGDDHAHVDFTSEQLGTVAEPLKQPPGKVDDPDASTPGPGPIFANGQGGAGGGVPPRVAAIPPGELLDAPDSEYVQVPGGRRLHRSCIETLKVPSGSTFDGNATYTPDGRVIPTIAPCKYIRHDSRATAPASIWEAWSEAPARTNAVCGIGGRPPFTYNIYCQSWINSIYGVVQIPPAPFNQDAQVIFIWNGISNNFNGRDLLQPVLTFGENGCGTGYTWSADFWLIDAANTGHQFCGPQGLSDFSYVRLNTYVIDNACSVSSGTNCNWGMHIWQNGGQDMYYYFTNVNFPVAGPETLHERAALETYQAFPPGGGPRPLEANCNDLPGTGSTGVAHFTDTYMYQPVTTATDYHQVDGTYTPSTANPGGRSCVYSAAVNATQHTVDLTWTR